MQVFLCWTSFISLQVEVEYWDFLKLVKLILIFAQIVVYARLLCGKLLHCQLLIHRTKMCFSKLTSEGKHVLIFLLSLVSVRISYSYKTLFEL